MKPLWSSPCSRAGLSSPDDPFPCLHEGWGDRACPMNAARCGMLLDAEADMYRLGYTYGAWVVRRDLMGLSPVCSLTYFRDEPTPEDLRVLYGERVLHVSQAVPAPAANEDSPLDHEVVAAAAD